MLAQHLKAFFRICPTHAMKRPWTWCVLFKRVVSLIMFTTFRLRINLSMHRMWRNSANSCPDFLVVSPMDKAVQVPIFACSKFWQHVHKKTFFQGDRYRELFRFSSHHDAQVTTAWSLIDSMSLCVLGRPSDVSRSTGLSPLTKDEQVLAFSHHRKYPPSLRLKNRVSAQIEG